jgi:hypothetical protein
MLASASPSAQEARQVAIFPLLVKGVVDLAAVEEIQARLAAGVPGSDLVTVAGPALRKLIGQRPRRAMARCETVPSFARCVAKLAVHAKVSEILVGRATAVGRGIKIILLAIRPNGAIELRATLVIPDGASVEEHTTLDWVAKALDTDVPVPTPDPAVLVPSEGTAHRHAPESEILTGILAGLPAMPAGLLTPSALPPELTVETAGARAAGLDLAAPGYPIEWPALPRNRQPTLRWSGIALGAAGAVAVAWGSYLGLGVEEANNRLEAGNGMTQAGARKLAQNAAGDATTANILFGAGVGAVAVGLCLFVADLVLD